ncbi:hypothetical protein MASR1M66_25260 [Aminivibrio sp.]
MTLIVLLVSGALVALSFYFIENMMTTTKMKTDDELRLNAALAGVERGKTWLLGQIDTGHMPTLTAAGIFPLSSPDYPELLVTPAIAFNVGEAAVTVRIFDLSYEYTNSLNFEPGIPPRIFVVQEGGSLRSGQSYASSNAAEGNPGSAASSSSRLGAYLIRSEAVKNSLTKRVEQAILMAP